MQNLAQKFVLYSPRFAIAIILVLLWILNIRVIISGPIEISGNTTATVLDIDGDKVTVEYQSDGKNETEVLTYVNAARLEPGSSVQVSDNHSHGSEKIILDDNPLYQYGENWGKFFFSCIIILFSLLAWKYFIKPNPRRS